MPGRPLSQRRSSCQKADTSHRFKNHYTPRPLVIRQYQWPPVRNQIQPCSQN